MLALLFFFTSWRRPGARRPGRSSSSSAVEASLRRLILHLQVCKLAAAPLEADTLKQQNIHTRKCWSIEGVWSSYNCRTVAASSRIHLFLRFLTRVAEST